MQSPDQQLHGIARLLATAFLRLRHRRKLTGDSAAIPSDLSGKTAPERLDVSPETLLSVTTGLTIPRVTETRSKTQ